MTEVRDTKDSGKALFATREYAIGDIILQEDKPLAILSHTTSYSAKNDSPFIAIAQAYQQSNTQLDIEAKLLSLYHPQADTANPAEQELWKNSQSAAENDDRLHKIIMIACCNSFQGGYVYEHASRINHSCQPNAIVNIQEDTGALLLRALTPIVVGEEIGISYAGLYLYTDTRARQHVLRRDKFFDCACVRCQEAVDPANMIPCTKCHPRHQSHLDEATQYDDDDEHPVKYMMWKSDQFVCESCDYVETLKSSVATVVHSISDKVLQFLEQYKEQDNSSKASSEQKDNAPQDEQDEELESLLQEHLSLASSVLGARHWTTNLLLLLYLDRGLKQYHKKLIFQQAADDDMQLDLAEHIDHLQRITQFVKRLKLHLHPGHLLSDVIVGIARALVSLSDVKSAQYATRWLDHLIGYEPFLSEALVKVVDSLKSAWTRMEADEPAHKKLKG
ncbi:hypothetical protein FisN_6Lh004 [Fistulifera solaris]|uniref:SET domain-containing protein n=1 Tax=Fistulifera solaris TaxID=1519565 RepID=A0A1Z5KQF5_FISSO|nr:hypothetical protein FisN_6Lh004 [Fistulifera solaris]|eukprot:GAX28168.1 hypothetical protein FisN_6Lh004 [Fistulifera solaris]